MSGSGYGVIGGIILFAAFGEVILAGLAIAAGVGAVGGLVYGISKGAEAIYDYKKNKTKKR